MDRPTVWDRLALVPLADLRARRQGLDDEYDYHLALLDGLEARKTDLDHRGVAEHGQRGQQALAQQVADLDHQAGLQERLLRLVGKQQTLLDRLIWLRESVERWEALRESAPVAVELGWDDLAGAAADLTGTEEQLDVLLHILGVPEGEWPRPAPGPIEIEPGPAARPEPQEPMLVTEVLDGCTIRLATGVTVRYIGVDAPLLRGSLGRPDPGASEAWQANRELVEGRTARLEADTEDRDAGGALWRYVWVGQTCVNAELIRMGLVYHQSRSPNYRHNDWFAQLERQPQRKKRGLWG